VNGVLTRLLDAERVLRAKTIEFVESGGFGLASGRHPDGSYDRVWFEEPVAPDEVTFDADVFLLKQATAMQLKAPPVPVQSAGGEPAGQPPSTGGEAPQEPESPAPKPPVVDRPTPLSTRTLRLVGSITAEVWNCFGTRIIPKLRSGSDLHLGVDLSVTVDSATAKQLEGELRQIVDDVGLSDSLRVE